MFKLLQKIATQAVDPEPITESDIRASQVLIQCLSTNKGSHVQIGPSTMADKESIYLTTKAAGESLDSIWLKTNGVGNNMVLSHLYILAAAADGVNVYYEEY